MPPPGLCPAKTRRRPSQRCTLRTQVRPLGLPKWIVLGGHDQVYRGAVESPAYHAAMAAYSMPVAEMLRQQESVKSVVSALDVPRGVRLRNVEFRPDNSGDPAVYITFAVSKKITLTEARLEEIAKLRRAATNAVDALQTSLLPYVHFQDQR